MELDIDILFGGDMVELFTCLECHMQINYLVIKSAFHFENKSAFQTKDKLYIRESNMLFEMRGILLEKMNLRFQNRL